MSAERVEVGELLRRLDRARGDRAAGLAFDADGTLWSGDVGEDTYHFACAQGLVREEARQALVEQALAHDLPAGDSPAEVAATLFEGYRRGVVDERLICEIMTWVYAGYTPRELQDIAHRACTGAGLGRRRREELVPVFDWAARSGVRVVVISASPLPVVTAALEATGFQVSAIAAALPVSCEGRIGTSMAAPLPYAGQKVACGRSLLEGHEWLASFGDNGFDVDMLRAARLGIAVYPKPALMARLGDIPGVVVLGGEDAGGGH